MTNQNHHGSGDNIGGNMIVNIILGAKPIYIIGIIASISLIIFLIINKNQPAINYPLNDLEIELAYTFDSTSSSIQTFHKNITTNTLHSINNESKFLYENHDEIYAYWDSEDREGMPNRLLIFNNDSSKLFPKLNIPTSSLGLFDINGEIDSMTFQDKDDFKIIFTAPVYQRPNKNIKEERLYYNVNSGNYEYSIRFLPKAQFATPPIPTHLDLSSVYAGIGIITSYDEKKWELKSIVFRSDLGLTNKFDIIKSTGKDWPELTYICKIDKGK